MKKIGKRLLSVFMVFAILLGLFWNGKEAKATEYNTVKLALNPTGHKETEIYALCNNFQSLNGKTNIMDEYTTSTWQNEFKGNATFITANGVEYEVTINISITSGGLLYFNLNLQEPVVVDAKTVAQVIIEEGTVFTYQKDGSKAPLQIQNTLTLIKSGTTWVDLEQCNEVAVKFTSLSGTSLALSTEILNGPNYGDTTSSENVYGHWDNTALYADIVYTDATGTHTKDDAVWYSFKSSATGLPSIIWQSVPSDAISITLKKGSLFRPSTTDAPMVLANDLTVSKVNDVWIAPGTYNEVAVKFTSLSGTSLALSTEILSGPNHGDTTSSENVYGHWDNTALYADIVYTDETGTHTVNDAVWYSYTSNAGLPSIIWQSVPSGATSITLQKGALFRPSTSDAPMILANDISLKKFDTTWVALEQCNEVSVKFKSLSTTNLVLSTEIVSGPNYGNTTSSDEVYGNWDNTALYADIVYTDATGTHTFNDAVWYSYTSNAGLPSIIWQGVPSGATSITLQKGALFKPSTSDAPMILANDISLKKFENTWLVEGEYNEVKLTFRQKGGNANEFYLNSEIIDGKNVADGFTAAYPVDWTNGYSGLATIQTSDGQVHSSVAYTLKSVETTLPGNTYVPVVTTGSYYLKDVSKIMFQAGTIFKYVDDSKVPFVLTNDLTLQRVGDSEWICLNMLDVKAQNKNKTDSAVTVRFIGSINNLDYDEVGFLFANNASTELGFDSNGQPLRGCAKRSMTTVFSHLNVEGVSKEASAIYDTYSKFMFAYELRNIPTDVVLYARAYVKIGDTIILGEIRTVDPWSVE